MNFIAKEILVDIFSNLDPQSLISAMCVCKQWYNLIKDKEEHLFQTHCERELGTQLLLGCKSWKTAYLNTCSKDQVKQVALKIKLCTDTVSIGKNATLLPATVFMNTTLTVLHVHSMPLIEVIPPAISRLQNLQIIRWYKTNTQTLPKELCTLPKLTKLYFYENNVTELPEHISLMTNLIVFSAIANKLTTVPPQIAALTNLQELFLSRNQITHLPAEMSRMTNLCYLSLMWNPISSVPPGFTSLKALVTDSRLFMPNEKILHLIRNIKTADFDKERHVIESND